MVEINGCLGLRTLEEMQVDVIPEPIKRLAFPYRVFLDLQLKLAEAVHNSIENSPTKTVNWEMVTKAVRITLWDWMDGPLGEMLTIEECEALYEATKNDFKDHVKSLLRNEKFKGLPETIVLVTYLRRRVTRYAKEEDTKGCKKEFSKYQKVYPDIADYFLPKFRGLYTRFGFPFPDLSGAFPVEAHHKHRVIQGNLHAQPIPSPTPFVPSRAGSNSEPAVAPLCPVEDMLSEADSDEDETDTGRKSPEIPVNGLFGRHNEPERTEPLDFSTKPRRAVQDCFTSPSPAILLRRTEEALKAVEAERLQRNSKMRVLVKRIKKQRTIHENELKKIKTESSVKESTLESELKRATDRVAELEEAEKDMDEIIKSTEKSMRELQADRTKTSELFRTEKQQLLEQINQLKADIKKLGEEKEAAVAESETAKSDLLKRIAAREAELEEVQRALQDKCGELDELQGESAGLLAKIQELEDGNESLKSKNKEVKKQLADAEADKKKIDDESKKMEECMRGLQFDNKKLLEMCQEKDELLASEKKQYLETERKHVDMIMDSEGEKRKMKAEWDQANAKIEQLTAANKDLEDKLAAFKANLAAMLK